MKIVCLVIIGLILATVSWAGPPSYSGGGGTTTGVSGKVCKTITNPSVSDASPNDLLFDIATARTLTKVWAIGSETDASVNVTLINRGSSQTGTTSIATLNSSVKGAANNSTAATATLADGDAIKLTVNAVTGVPKQVTICYE